MEKIKNRIFALFFFVIILLWVIWAPIWQKSMGKTEGIPSYPYADYIQPFNVAFLIVLAGLLYEICRPTLDFTLDKNKKWVAAGIFLLATAIVVVIVIAFLEVDEPEQNIFGNRTFEYPMGSGKIRVIPNLVWEFLSVFCMETVSFSLLFGFLFMTKSTPQKSKSYKIMLIGAVAFEVLVFLMLYFPFFAFGRETVIYSGYTKMELLQQYWFHWDFWSELVILVGAIWLLKRSKEFS